MMKTLLTILLLSFCLAASSQKNVSLGIAGDASVATKDFGLNTLGIGFHLQANAFCRSRLQLHAESGLDHFIGDKLLTIDLSGTTYERNPTVTRAMAGPDFFPVKQLSVAGLYGIVWSNWLNHGHPQQGLRFVIAGHFGKRGWLLAGASFTKLMKQYRKAEYFGFHLGCRIF